MKKTNLTDREKIYLERYAEKFFLTSKEDFKAMAQKNFKPREAEYLIRAFSIPYLAICLDIQKYDQIKPKKDEIKFVNALALKYQVTVSDIINRIREVRYLNMVLGININELVGEEHYKTYNKLVRDNIPDLIRQNGEEPMIRTLTDEEYWISLKTKLIEELNEVNASSSKDEMKKELADLYEVFKAMVTYQDFTLAEIAEAAQEKAMQNGGFTKRIFLEKVRVKNAK